MKQGVVWMHGTCSDTGGTSCIVACGQGFSFVLLFEGKVVL